MAVDVSVVQNGNQYGLQVKKGEQQVQIPLKDCKSPEEAETIRQALLAEVNKAEVQQGTKAEGVGGKIDKAA